MTSCIAPGWGTGPFGTTPWGGGLGASPGGPIPAAPPYDLYCVGPCGPMSVIITYNEVDVFGDPLQFFVGGASLDEVLASGGTFPTDDARLIITTGVSDIFTLDFTVNFEHLPPDFSSLSAKHIALCVSDAAGSSVALFFSKVGIGYAGAFHHDSGGNLVLDSTFQALPNSQLLVSEMEYWSYRVAVNQLTGVTFIYVTKTADLVSIGHQLRYIMPAIPSSSLTFPPTDRTIVSVRGTLAVPTELSLDSICLSSQFLIPNAPPIADAGLDQAARTCSIIQLDGSRSFDPEGSDLTYRWRLIDAPIGSEFMVDGVDGITIPLPMPTGFTNLFHSGALGSLDILDPIVTTAGAGDVLVVAGKVYDIIGKGTDGAGFYVQVDGYILPDSFSMATFKLLRQRGVSGPTLTNPTFFPDLPGFFKFDLIVFDGGLFSEPGITIVNVTESPLPRGCIPDTKFLWGYLSDFWRIVEDRERIEVFWSAAAQVVASELLSLWQVEYSKSHRDIQRTFLRRWLNYELTLNEPFPELTSIRNIFGGLREVFPAAGISGIPGTIITFTIPIFDSTGTASISAIYTFTGSGNLTAQQVADQISPILAKLDSRFIVSVISNRASTQAELRILAPFEFHTEVTDTSPIFIAPNNNTEPTGTGAGVGSKTYQVDRTLQGLDIVQGDIVAIGDIAYRVRNIIDDPSDPWPFQRIAVLDDLPTVPVGTWSVLGKVSSKMVDFYNSHVDTQDLTFYETFDRATRVSTTIRLQGAWVPENDVRTIGVVGLGALANYLKHPSRQFSVSFKSATRLSHIPIDPLVADIPYLQEKINSTDDTTVIRRNIDFFLEEFRGHASLRFAFEGFGTNVDIWESADTIPRRLWAEFTYVDNRPVIEGNFGIPVEFTLDDLSKLPSTVDYLSAVRGLWYSYFNGPTLFNLRVGTQILLGLPFAEEAGVITEIRNDFSTTSGRILIQDKKNPEVIRSYQFPASLAMEVNPATGALYKVGDKVTQFAPLVTGVEVVDYVKDPQWFAGYLQQGVFFEVQKFFKFLVRVDVAAFNLSALLFVQNFILRIKPTYTSPLFVVLRKLGDTGDTEVNTTDDIEYAGTLLLFDGACFQFNGANTLGVATMLDEPDPSSGGWQSQFDTDFDQTTPPPTFPVAEGVAWGLDKNYLCPEDYVLTSSCVTFGALTYPTLDSVFVLDTEISTASFAIFEDSWVTTVPATGLQIPLPHVVTANGTITDVAIHMIGDPGSTGSVGYQLIITKNGVDQSPISFTENTLNFSLDATVSIAVSIGDTLSIRIVPTLAVMTHPFWKSVKVELGSSISWALDTQVAAGTYCTYRVL